MEKNLLKTRLISVLLSVALVVTLTPLSLSPIVEKEASAATEAGAFLYEVQQDDKGASVAAIKGVTPASLTTATVPVPVTVPGIATGSSVTVASVEIIGSSLTALSFSAGSEVKKVVATGNKQLASFDATQAAIKELDLEGNDIKTLGLKQGLEELDLSNNGAVLGANIVVASGTAVAAGNLLHRVKTVEMRGCGITSGGISKLKSFVRSQDLVKIDLSNNGINSFDFTDFTSAESINLSNNTLGKEGGFFALTPAALGGAVLKNLNLSGNASLASITYGGENGDLKFPALEVFEAANSGITREFFEGLITPDAINVKKLVTLNLAGNKLTEIDFSEFNNLKTIDLSSNDISSFDFTYLASAESINLSNNKLGQVVDGQAGWFQLTPASLKGGAVLEKLYLSGNSSLAAITYSGIYGNLTLPALKVLEASSSGITDAFFEGLITSGAIDAKKLVELNLAGNVLTKFDFIIFSGSALETINLSNNKLNLSGAALDFTNFVSLTALKLAGNENVANNVVFPPNFSGISDVPFTVTLSAFGGKFSALSASAVAELSVTTNAGVSVKDALAGLGRTVAKDATNGSADTTTYFINTKTTYKFKDWYSTNAAVQQTTANALTYINKSNIVIYAGWTATTARAGTPLKKTATKTITPAFSKFKVNKISGKAKKGKKLTAKYVKVKAQKGVKYGKPKFQWLQNGKKIKKATKSTFKLTSKQKGKKISVKITYTPTPNPKVANVRTLFGYRTVLVKTTYKLKKVSSSKSTKTSKRTVKVK